MALNQDGDQIFLLEILSPEFSQLLLPMERGTSIQDSAPLHPQMGVTFYKCPATQGHQLFNN